MYVLDYLFIRPTFLYQHADHAYTKNTHSIYMYILKSMTKYALCFITIYSYPIYHPTKPNMAQVSFRPYYL